MFKIFFKRFLKNRHYWRDISFDELGELYTSMMFRSLAMSLVGIFIPLYLYELNYKIWEICLFFAVLSGVWVLCIYPVAKLIAKFGPKHVMLASFVFQVITMMLLVSLEELQWPWPVIAGMLGLSNSLYYSAFHVDFSKVKHKNHGGKEVGWMYWMEKSGAILGPIIGGVVAVIFGSQYIFLAAIILLLSGIFPLFLTQEPVATSQDIRFKNLKLNKIKSDLISYSCFTIENNISVVLWPLFVGVFVLKDNPYIGLGLITTLSVVVSLVVARVIGKIIDDKKGRNLLRLGTISNAVLHLFRPFSSSFSSALGLNIAKEAITPTYRMPYAKGMYDAADDLPGNRIVYISYMEGFNNSAKTLFFGMATLTAYVLNDSKSAFTIVFCVGGLISLGIMLEKFKALDAR